MRCEGDVGAGSMRIETRQNPFIFTIANVKTRETLHKVVVEIMRHLHVFRTINCDPCKFWRVNAYASYAET